MVYQSYIQQLFRKGNPWRVWYTYGLPDDHWKYLYTQNIVVQKISQKHVKATKSWLIDLVSWTTLGSWFGADESDEELS